ncbi:MAG: SAP domain-containing protein [Candidatus Thermoplasmatota archaeon]|nr:SAP domain-containing protein [Candidatus Thermoplasmatota archaeon]MEC8384628.1 SAP domain-containing protein [Candidatus Thermoplasmatota archaeon]MED5375166.1 SAP domain-containing protein [Candidatus Thermoplasmatota archaeon]
MAAKSAKARTAARKQRDKWKSKRWYSIRAPRNPYSFKVIGETLSENPENVVGRIHEVTQNELDNDFTKMHIKLKFRVTEVLNQDAITEFIGHEVQRDHFRRQVRRNRGKVDMVIDVVSEDGFYVRFKLVVISPKRIKSSMKTVIRNIVKDRLYKVASTTTWLKLQASLLNGNLENEIKDSCSSIHSVRSVVFHKTELRQSGVLLDEGPTLDEIHAQEEREKAAAKEVEDSDSTEDVLVAAEAGEAISELAEDDESEEPDSTENVDYSSMTVAELKEILKEKGLPVSGKKADLVERLSE